MGRTTVDRALTAVLLLGIATGVAMPAFFFTVGSDTPLAWDFAAYLAAAKAVLAGSSFVGIPGLFGEGDFVYPPIVVLGFVPYALVGSWQAAFAIHSVINLLLLGVLARLILRELAILGVASSRLTRWLVGGVCVASLYPMISLGQGQVDPLVAVVLALTFLAIEDDRPHRAGGLLALATVIKLMPVAVCLWFIRMREHAALGITFLAGGSAALASVMAFGVDTHITFLEVILTDRSRVDAFASGMSPDVATMTLARPLAVIVPDVSTLVYPTIAVLFVAPFVGYAYTAVSTRIDRHVAFLVTILTILLASPATHLNHLLYLYFPLLVLMVALPASRGRSLLFAGTAILFVPLQPGLLIDLAGGIGAPTSVVIAIDTIIAPALTVVSIPLIGGLVLLCGCTMVVRERARAATPAARRAPVTPPQGDPP